MAIIVLIVAILSCVSGGLTVGGAVMVIRNTDLLKGISMFVSGVCCIWMTHEIVNFLLVNLK